MWDKLINFNLLRNLVNISLVNSSKQLFMLNECKLNRVNFFNNCNKFVKEFNNFS